MFGLIRRSTAEAEAEAQLDRRDRQHQDQCLELQARIDTAPAIKANIKANLAELLEATSVEDGTDETGHPRYVCSGRVDIAVTLRLSDGRMLFRDVDPANDDYLVVKFDPEGRFTSLTALGDIHEFCRRVLVRHQYVMRSETRFTSLTAAPAAENEGASITHLGKEHTA